MSVYKYKRDSGPEFLQNEEVANPFNDGSIEQWAVTRFSDDPDYEEEQAERERIAELDRQDRLMDAPTDVVLSTFSDTCPLCWTATGFRTKFVAGKTTNKICKQCANS